MPKTFARTDRVNEYLRTLIAEHLPQALELPEGAVISVTHVEVSRDLAHAKVFILVFPDALLEKVTKLCNARTKEIVHYLSQNTKMYKVPKLFFHIDETEQKAAHIESLLDSISKKA